MNKIKELLERIPLTAFFVLFLGYLAYDYYTFENDPSSPLLQKQAQAEQVKSKNAELQVQLNKARQFYKTLDQKREELRALAHQLEEMRTTLSDRIEPAAFMRLVVTEARKVGLEVLEMKPTQPKTAEYYVEQPFELSFRGVYFQLVAFLQRLSDVERVIRVDNFSIKENGPNTGRFVSLEGKVEVKAYSYLGTKADDLGKGNATSTPTTTTTTPVATTPVTTPVTAPVVSTAPASMTVPPPTPAEIPSPPMELPSSSAMKKEKKGALRAQNQEPAPAPSAAPSSAPSTAPSPAPSSAPIAISSAAPAATSAMGSPGPTPDPSAVPSAYLNMVRGGGGRR